MKLSKLKKIKLKITTFLLMIFVAGCTTTRVIDSFCLWAEPITITKKELKEMSDTTLREIYNYNNTVKVKCQGKQHAKLFTPGSGFSSPSFLSSLSIIVLFMNEIRSSISKKSIKKKFKR